MNHTAVNEGLLMDPQLLSYYEAIERASADMLSAARAGNWDEVVKLEGACVLLISQLKHAAHEPGHGMLRTHSAAAHAPSQTHDDAQACAKEAAKEAAKEVAKVKSRIMQRILVNDAEIRHLAEPWLQDLDDTLAGRRKTLH